MKWRNRQRRAAAGVALAGAAYFAGLAFAQASPYGVVCSDAGAGGYEAFPDVCRMADGRLLAVFYAGYAHIAMPSEQWPLGGRISGCTSADEGKTWSAAFTVFDGPYDDRDPSVAQLADGRLACTFFTLKPKPGGQDGYDSLGSFMVTSADGGATWETEPRLIATNYYCSSPIRGLPDGRLALGLYAENAAGAWGAATFSADGGETWCTPIDIPTGGLWLDAETDLIRLQDGSLFAALRGQGISAWSISRDGGLTWSVAEPFGFPGHCPYLHRTPDGIVLMAHRLPDTSLHYSLDECKTWSTNVVVDNVIGAYPSMVTLKDGSILIVYYEEGAGSNIRAKRLRATPAGVEWLPLDETVPAPPMRFIVEGGKVVNEGPMDDVEELVLAQTATFVDKPITGTYHLAQGSLTVAGRLWFGKNGPDMDGHYGVFDQSGGVADVSLLGGTWGELNLTGGLLKLGSVSVRGGSGVTVALGGGRLEPKTAEWIVIRVPTHLTGINGDVVFAPTAGQSIQLTDTAPASGRGGFVKEGAGLLWLSNVNTFAGEARINAGTCTLASTCRFAQSTNLVIGAGAVLDVQRGGQTFNSNFWLKVAADGLAQLNFEGEVEVGHLVLDGRECPGRGRRYGASSSTGPLDSVRNDYFTGTGVLKVVGPRGPEGTKIQVL